MPLLPNTSSSDHMLREKQRQIYSNILINQQAMAQKIRINNPIDTGTGASQEESVKLDKIKGAIFFAEQEAARILQSFLTLTVPDVPSSIVAVAGYGQATISFVAPNDGGSPILSYRVTPDDGTNTFSYTEGTSSPITVLGLTDGTTYTFDVVAINAIGSSSVGVSNWIVVQGSVPDVTTVSFVNSSEYSPPGILTGTIVSNSGDLITELGAVYSISNTTPTLSDSKVVGTTAQSGTYTITISQGGSVWARAYATNMLGTSYGAVLYLHINLCLAKGTKISLADGSVRAIESILPTDHLLIWDFDEGCLSEAMPLWIKKAERCNQFTRLTFSDGTNLDTIGGPYAHRIFNMERGAFTYPGNEETPLGTHTYSVHKGEVSLVSTEIRSEPVEFYNVITHTHINLFANGILTSCRYNNLYPIQSMKFVKEERVPVLQSAYPTRFALYFEGLRLAEQTIPVADTLKYIESLEARKAERQEKQEKQEGKKLPFFLPRATAHPKTS